MQTAAFGVLVLMTTLPAWFVAKIGLCIINHLPQKQQVKARAFLSRIVYRCLNIGWYSTTALCPWVNMRYEGFTEFRKGLASARGKPRLVLINHVSFLDSFMVLGSMPFIDIADMKTMASDHLFEMPVIGMLCQGCDHLPVSYKTQKDDDFSVDKEKAVEIQRKLEDHVRAGNIGAWYPEGTINAKNPQKLSTFRAGGFTLAARVDCEIWCMVSVGNAVCWPKRAAMGGRPCNIGVKAFRLCESSNKLLKDAAVENVERDQALHLANYAQTQMQEVLDGLVAGGWASVASPSH